MEDDTFIHFEFQTTNKGKADLRRFRVYEALLSYQTRKDVVTYVVYSGNIKNPGKTLETGISEFRVNSISMASGDGDKIYNDIVKKIKSGIEVTKEDLISLIFTSIMGGKISTVDKILNAIEIVKDINKDYKYDVESILYAFANKFLNRNKVISIMSKVTEIKTNAEIII